MLQKYLGKRNQNNRKGVVGKYRQTLIIGPNSKVSESDIYFLLEFFGFVEVIFKYRDQNLLIIIKFIPTAIQESRIIFFRQL